MHAPMVEDFKLVKRILLYVHCMANCGLHILSSNTLDLYAFFGAVKVGCPTTRCSTIGFYTKSNQP